MTTEWMIEGVAQGLATEAIEHKDHPVQLCYLRLEARHPSPNRHWPGIQRPVGRRDLHGRRGRERLDLRVRAEHRGMEAPSGDSQRVEVVSYSAHGSCLHLSAVRS